MSRVLKIREVGDPILSTKCKEVDIKNINQKILEEIGAKYIVPTDIAMVYEILDEGEQ